MISRTLAVPTLLAASVAVPYVATNAPQWRREWNSDAPATTAADKSLAPPLLTPLGKTDAQRQATLSALPAAPGNNLYPNTTPIEGTPTYALADVLRMDVNKEWVYQRWPRKTTSLAALDLYGVRVPLVTGKQIYDLAGSLTYYFGPDGRVQRISFRGRTGDTTQIVGLVTQRYGLQPQPALAVGEQVFQAKRGADVLSQLHTRPAPVLWASSPHDSFDVELDLQDPATARPLLFEMPPLPPPQAVAANPAPQAAGKTAGAEAAKADDEAPQESGWKAFFPRRRVPAEQIRNLDHGNIYQ